VGDTPKGQSSPNVVDRDRSPLGRAAAVSVAVLTTISAVVLALVNGFSFRLAVPLVGLALVVDLVRIRTARSPHVAGSTHGVFGRVLTVPRLGLWLTGGVLAILILSYFLLPESCTPALNDWIEAHFSLARHRLSQLGPACSIRHGSVLLWSQAALPVTLLFVLAADALSSVVDPERFVRAYGFTIKGNPKKQPAEKVLGLFSICLLLLVCQRALPFTPSTKSMITPFYPQDYFESFIVLIFISPIILFWIALVQSAVDSDYDYLRPRI
jgi:hypothetical protein